MLRYILFTFIILSLFFHNNIIEGVEAQCCGQNGKILNNDITSGFHNSTCKGIRNSDGDYEPIGPPHPIKRCYKEKEEEFDCETCGDICPDMKGTSQCVPTIIKHKDHYKDGGYCINTDCSGKNKDECTGECKWLNDKCKSKKYVYDEMEQKSLTDKIGFPLDYRNSTEYKKYVSTMCDPFKGPTEGVLDNKWSDEDYPENNDDIDWIIYGPILLISLYGLYVMFQNRAEILQWFQKSKVVQKMKTTTNNVKKSVKKSVKSVKSVDPSSKLSSNSSSQTNSSSI